MIARRAGMLLAVLALAGCAGSAPPPALVSVTASHALAPDFKPLAPTEHFAPQEAFYVSAQVERLAPGAVVAARWLYAGELIKRTEYTSRNGGNGYVGFELTNDNPPWPAGRYRVEILLEGHIAGSTEFSVP